MKKKKQQSQKQKQESWSQKGFISEFVSLVKKTSKWMPTKKLWDYAIDMKEGFVLRKGKVYSLSKEEREEVQEFISKQLRKGYIRLSKSPQMMPVFFVGKKNGKKKMVQNYRYLDK